MSRVFQGDFPVHLQHDADAAEAKQRIATLGRENNRRTQRRAFSSRFLCRIATCHLYLQDLLVFGYSCRIFDTDSKAEWLASEGHLIPWHSDSSLRIDR